MTWWHIALTAWGAVAVGLALLIGFSVRVGEQALQRELAADRAAARRAEQAAARRRQGAPTDRPQRVDPAVPLPAVAPEIEHDRPVGADASSRPQATPLHPTTPRPTTPRTRPAGPAGPRSSEPPPSSRSAGT